MKLKLYCDCQFRSWISGPTANDGEFLWRVPCDLESGDRCRVKVYSASDYSIMDYSDEDFAVVWPLCVLSPNGGELWPVGSSQLIRWRPACFDCERVKLKLYRDCTSPIWISGPTPNDGGFCWRIPYELTPGENYRVKIYSACDYSNLDFSDEDFAIVPQEHCLTAPNGGEQWIAGTRHRITWNRDCFGWPQDEVKLKLFDDCNFHSWIRGRTANDGEEIWPIPFDVPTGNSYRVQIYSVADFSVKDFSDEDFAITAGR